MLEVKLFHLAIYLNLSFVFDLISGNHIHHIHS